MNFFSQATANRATTSLRRLVLLAVVVTDLTGARAWGVTVFSSGTGYNTYRIPAIVRSTNATLLAFSEGRESPSDNGNIDIVLKRSTDNGVTWGPLIVVQNDGTQTIHNPVPVVDETTGRIHLFFCRNYNSVYYTYSDDDGLTWSARVNYTATLIPVGWSPIDLFATGPGHGIQLQRGTQAGRLIVPGYHTGTPNGGVHVYYSDDHGSTWQLGGDLIHAGNGRRPTENLAVELVGLSGGNSRLYFNARDPGGNAVGGRSDNFSNDGGLSYVGSFMPEPAFVTPGCQGSVQRMRATDAGDPYNLIVVSCPNDPTDRVNLSVWYSLDEGVTWSEPTTIDSGIASYSDMVRMPNGDMGILYEENSVPGLITFRTFTLASLGLPADPNQPPAMWDGGAGAGNTNWGTAANWDGNVLPAFDSSLAVNFYKIGSANLTNLIGADRTVRALNFTADADATVNITLADSSNVAKTLTFEAFTGSAAVVVSNGATGSFTVGVGGGSGPGSITLADDLVVTHNGSGELRFDRLVSGPGGITKNGTGILFLRQSNPYTGNTVINAGIVVTGGNTGGFGDAATSGPMFINGGTIANSTAASRPIYNDVTVGGNFTVGGVAGYGAGLLTFSGTVDLGGATRIVTINSPVTLAGVVSNGGLTKSGTNTLALAGANTYTGQNTIFSGTLQLGTNGPSGSLAAASSIAIGPSGIFQFNRSDNLAAFANNISGNGTLLKTGSGEVGLAGVNGFSGLVDIQAGKLAFANANSENGSPSVNIAGGGTLSLGDGFVGGTATIGNLGGAGLVNGSFGANVGARTLQVNQTADGTFSGTIADGTLGRTLALTKLGAATLSLSGSNTFTSATTVSNGALLVFGSLGNSTVYVNGGTLGGTGTLGGAVNVQSGGAFSPGIGGVGMLTISNNLALGGTTFVEVNAANGQCDSVQGVADLAYGGALVVSNVAGMLTNGQTFQLFSASGTKTGNFISITPALTGGQAWSFNSTNGVLSVVATTANYPTNISFNFTGGTLSLTWPATHLGWFAQSNAVSLASPGNWFDIPGSSGVTNLTITPSPARSNVFYRLRSP